MNHQQAFDRICTVFSTQGRPSRSEYAPTSVGAMRSADGCRCAVGALIPDDQYNEALNGCTPNDWTENVPALAELSPYFLGAVLRAHDDTLDRPDVAVLRQNLRAVACTYKLDDLAVATIQVWS